MFYLIFFISAAILFTALKLLTSMPCIDSNQKLFYVKEKKPQTGTNEPVSTESTTWGAPTADEGEEKNFIGKGIWLCLMLILSLHVNAQYAGISIINKGVSVNAGILADKVAIQAALTFPITNLQNANTYSLTAGYQLNLTTYDADNYSFTPSIGAALLRSRTWGAKDAMTVHQNIKPMYGAELAKDAFMGRVYIQANYSDALYYGIGMKVFFNR